PARNDSNQEIIDRHRTDSASDGLPYPRGAITALWLDHTIREATHGKSSLDTLMFELVRQARGKSPTLNAQRVFRTAARYIHQGALHELRQYVESGKTIQVRAQALGPCAKIAMEDIPPFDL